MTRVAAALALFSALFAIGCGSAFRRFPRHEVVWNDPDQRHFGPPPPSWYSSSEARPRTASSSFCRSTSTDTSTKSTRLDLALDRTQDARFVDAARVRGSEVRETSRALEAHLEQLVVEAHLEAEDRARDAPFAEELRDAGAHAGRRGLIDERVDERARRSWRQLPERARRGRGETREAAVSQAHESATRRFGATRRQSVG